MTVGTVVGRWLNACLGAFEALVFPWECRICGLEGARSPFCADCRAEILGAAGPSCPRCAMPIGPWSDPRGGCSECRGRRLGFDAAVALGPYQGPIRDLCLQLKQERNAWLAPWMADLLAEARLADLDLGGACVVPVPLHWRRKLKRGYNQAEALADRLARRLRLPLIRPIRRVASTPALATKRRSERARLMRGAFRITRAGRALEGRTVLLVDDILTTGATCGTAARTLKKAGAGRVIAVVFARAEGRP